MEHSPTIKPTESVFYRAFDTRIRVNKITNPFYFHYPRYSDLGKLDYRVVRIYRSRHEYDCNFYTSNETLIESVLNSGFEIAEITKPLNKTHKELLHKRDRKVVIREKLWFNKYKHKISSWHNWDRTTTVQESRDMVRWVYEHFPKGENRVVSTMYGSYFSSSNRLAQPPTVFTNSEETMMLMKLAYSDMLRLTMETCITLQELDN
tara:strand:- start:1603 stop:2220 length:618 start_codon:yes stop_codon:yes gene_type:complete